MPVTATQIDEVFAAMKDYEKANFGLKNGAEFPEIAQALVASTKFRDLTIGASLIGMLSTLLLPRDADERKKLTSDKDATEKLMTDTPLRDMLAEAFFAGFKIGRASAEVQQLETLSRVTPL